MSDNGVLILSASFTDRGGENIKPLSTTTSVYLRNSKVDFGQVDAMEGYNTFNVEGNDIMLAPTGEGHFILKNIDLNQIASIDLVAASQRAMDYGYELEARLNSPDGKRIGQVILRANEMKGKGEEIIFKPLSMALEQNSYDKLQDLYIVTRPLNAEESVNLALVGMEMKSE
jgi:hypothetical protein